MTEQAERYDRIADGYARWWAPIIAPAARAVLEVIQVEVAAGATRILDVGTGTGTLAIAALRRWPQVHVTAIDASTGMIDKASAEADHVLSRAERHRLELRVAFADDLRLDDGGFDAAVSSFVLQLVPNRFRALREIRRVLRPGGVFAWVTWLAHTGAWAPDDDFDDALGDVGEPAREWTDQSNDLRDVAAALALARRAGYANVRATAGMLEHLFDVDGAVGFMTEFDEEDLVASLGPDLRARFEAALRRRLGRRRHDEMVMRQPIVTVVGVRR
jgi:ubiquinone/menaquinone biosynthesis C-methylase UbiE